MSFHGTTLGVISVGVISVSFHGKTLGVISWDDPWCHFMGRPLVKLVLVRLVVQLGNQNRLFNEADTRLVNQVTC